jgi:predicted Zn-dependent protease with MMP-like domain
MSGHLPVDDPETERVLDLAEDALDRGELDTALSFCDRVLGQNPDHPGALYLSAEALHERGEFAEAEQRYRRCTLLVPDHPLSWSGLAVALFDQLRFDESVAMAHRALRVDDANAEAYYVRALRRERNGDERGAQRDYRRAWRLDPERYPAPVALDDATIEAVVTEAIAASHESIRQALANVPILLEELPSDEVCRSFDPPRSPTDIVGLFSGPSMVDRNTDDPWSHMPATITLYRKNLERLAFDHERLLDEVRVTLLHEIGHYLGLSEEDLEARGLD